MRRLGFHDSWIGLIMECVSIVKYRVKVNGDLSNIFCPATRFETRGPVITLPILLCAEAFSTLLKEGECDGSLAGVKNLSQCSKCISPFVRR